MPTQDLSAHSGARRPVTRVLVAAFAVGLFLGLTTVADAAKGGDPRKEREEVREKMAEAAAELDVLEATNAEVTAALNDLEANVSSHEAKLAEAERAAEQAAVALAEAELAERQAAAAVADRQEAVNELAVNAFINPPGGGFVETIESDDLNEAVLKQTFIDVRANRDFDILDQLEKAKDELSARRVEAEEVAAQADAALADVDAQLSELTSARDQQAAKAADVEELLDIKLSEAAALEPIEAELSAQIVRDAEAHARQLAAQKVEAPDAPDGPVVVPPPAGDIDLVTVRGIRVAAEIGDELEALLAAAEADGIVFGGGGYRDSSAQVALRRAHCGTSEYAIYQMPPSQCRPPTARPGQSMHERGLAIDFTYEGRVISSRSSPGYEWLANNAGSYGLHNLPSEPWHWSSNGQ